MVPCKTHAPYRSESGDESMGGLTGWLSSFRIRGISREGLRIRATNSVIYRQSIRDRDDTRRFSLNLLHSLTLTLSREWTEIQIEGALMKPPPACDPLLGHPGLPAQFTTSWDPESKTVSTRSS